MSTAYVPNTAENRRKIEKLFTGHLPPSADFKVTEQRTTTFLDEDIRSYLWKGYTDNIYVQTWYFDVLQRFVKKVGFEGVSYSNCTRAYKFKNPSPPKKSRKNGISIFRLLRL